MTVHRFPADPLAMSRAVLRAGTGDPEQLRAAAECLMGSDDWMDKSLALETRARLRRRQFQAPVAPALPPDPRPWPTPRPERREDTRHRTRLNNMAAWFIVIVAATAVGVVLGHTITKAIANAAFEAARGVW